MTFTTSRRHIPARGTARYNGSVLRQLLKRDCRLRLNLSCDYLSDFALTTRLLCFRIPVEAFTAPFLKFIISHIFSFVKCEAKSYPPQSDICGRMGDIHVIKAIIFSSFLRLLLLSGGRTPHVPFPQGHWK